MNTAIPFLSRLRQNPVVLKELRARMRGRRAFIVLTAHVLLLSIGISVIFLAFVSSGNAVGSPDMRQALGKAVFGMVVGMELLAVSFIAPALTAGAISSERERQTYDLLRTTLLSARSLVFGKLSSALFYLLLLLFAAIPLQSLAFLFGGVAIEEVLIGNLLLAITAISFSAMGIFFSSFTRRTLISTILADAFAILIMFGLPILLIAAIAVFNSTLLGPNFGSSLILELAIVLAGWFIVSLNPLATAVVSELILIEEQSAFFISFPLANGNTFPIISPWISFVIIFSLLSVLAIWLSIRFVRRLEK
jgi:ABC-2 type transport system permease protein